MRILMVLVRMVLVNGTSEMVLVNGTSEHGTNENGTSEWY